MLDLKLVNGYAEKLLNRWAYPWLFVATPERFYCDLCRSIIEKGFIKELPESWVAKDRQEKYSQLLREFEDKHAN